MPQILFKREFHDAIRSGRKTTTLRRWKSCRLAEGDLATCPGIGTLRIKNCREVQLKQLNDSDAVADGFESLAQLLAVLKKLYPKAKADGKQWYRIAFTLEEAKTSQRPIKTPKSSLRSDQMRLAERIRAELDKAVQRNGSYLPI
jgi:hypothetical protein